MKLAKKSLKNVKNSPLEDEFKKKKTFHYPSKFHIMTSTKVYVCPSPHAHIKLLNVYENKNI